MKSIVVRKRPATSHDQRTFSRMRRLTFPVGLCAVLLIAVAAPASAAQSGVPASFGSKGEAAGQYRRGEGIAIDQETGLDGANGNVFIADRNNNRIDEFTGDGEFVRAWGWGVLDQSAAFQVCTQASGCFAGTRGSSAGQLSEPKGIAIDNSKLGGFSQGDVYVIDVGNARVEKFSAEGAFILMIGGEVNATKVAQRKEEEAKGEPVTVTPSEEDLCTQVEAQGGAQCQAGTPGAASGQFELPGGGAGIAIDGQGRLYVGDSSRVQRFSEGGAYEATVLEGVGPINELALAPGGDLYVQCREYPCFEEHRGVREYEPGGVEVGSPRDAREGFGGPEAFTVDAAGDLFIDDINYEQLVNHIFEYDAEGAQTESFDKTSYSEHLDARNGLAFGESAEALYLLTEFNGPNAEGIYVETNQVLTVSPPPPGPLMPGRPSVEAKPHNKAIVKATINPEGAETEYVLEYGTTSALGQRSVAKLAAGFEEPEVAIELSGLQYSTEYHYCLVVRNANGEIPCEQATFTALPSTAIDLQFVSSVAAERATLGAEVNPEETATTCRFEYGTTASYTASGSFEHRVAASPILVPEDKDVTVSATVYEGITPGTEYTFRTVCEKDSVTDTGEAKRFSSQPARTAVALPDERSLELVAIGPNGAGILPPIAEIPLQAAEDGGSIIYGRAGSVSPSAEGNRSWDLTVEIARHEMSGWSSVDIALPYTTPRPIAVGSGTEYQLFSDDLSASIVAPWDSEPRSPSASERTPYRRTETSGGPLYEPLLTTADVGEGIKFGGSIEVGQGPVPVAGANANLTDVVLQSYVPLTAGSVFGSLYEWSAGSLRTVSVLPASEGGAIVAGKFDGPRHAMSENGSLVYWTGGSGLFLRDTQSEQSLRLDLSQGAVAQQGEIDEPEFQLASADGTKVFFTDTRRLTPDATAKALAPDLYECEISAPASGPPSCALTDLTANVLNSGESGAVKGIVSAGNEAGTRVYFVAKGVLAEGATAGAKNLYTAVEEGGSWHITWITTLSPEDTNDWGEYSGGGLNIDMLSARSSPDGRYFTFMSDRGLTGYDTHDAVSGAPDQEVYIYDAQNERLSCVSCDPTGARPRGLLEPGHFEGPLNDELNQLAGKWLAALLPQWSTVGVTNRLPRQPRYLFDSGRLFFVSDTPLSPDASNGAVGVYEYEPVGVGSCTVVTNGYLPATGGCVSLVSPATAIGEAVFVDASADGNDVFLLAAETPAEDSRSTHSLYDAHSCEAGSGWACSPPPEAAAPPCSTTESCRAAPPPQPSVYGASGSATLAGAGNPKPSGAKKVPRAKSRTRCAKGKHRHRVRCARRKRHKGSSSTRRSGR